MTMNTKIAELAGMIDHSVLRPEATTADLEAGCATAVKYRTAAVCVKPGDVPAARELLGATGIQLATVISFPHGSAAAAAKAFEAAHAIDAGATEIDVVMNYGRLISGEYGCVEDEIREVTAVAHSRGAIIKVIFETCALTKAQIIEACRISSAAGADFVKTSTGFGISGATAEDIILMRKYCDPDVKIKASGGIKTLADAILMMRLGVSRIGTSATEAIIEEALREGL